MDTINSDESFTGTLTTDDYGTSTINGNIVHDFSDLGWQTALGYQGMDPKTPGVWFTFSAQGFDDYTTPFYAVARDDGSLGGYWFRLDLGGTSKLIIQPLPEKFISIKRLSDKNFCMVISNWSSQAASAYVAEYGC